MDGNEFIRRHGNEKAALAKFLADKGVSVDAVCEQIGGPLFDIFVSELTMMGKMLEYAVGSAKAKDIQSVAQCGAQAKRQKDAAYHVLMAGGIKPFDGNDYAGPLRDYVMSRYDNCIGECEKILADRS